ncbi:MAG: glycosyltransferase family 2 protein [Phycisphaeraceae bacterium]
MSEQTIHVAIIIVAYNSRDDLGDCLESVLASDDAGLHRHVIVVDNASTDGTRAFLAQRFPQVDLIESRTNLGFAGGNNLAWDYTRKNHPDSQYLALLNPDTIVTSGWLRPLVQYLRQNPGVASVQPKLMLHPQTDRINSAGNRSHFLGFGFTSAFGELDQGQYHQPRSIDFASGAAMMVRTESLERVGLFDDQMFVYLEDAELSWKLRLIGYDTVFVPAATVYHKHNVQSTFKYLYYLERNRWILLLTYYKAATLLLLIPAMLVMELGLFGFAISRGMFWQKLRAWIDLLHPHNMRKLVAKRRETQSRRTISDRKFMTRFTGTIDYPPINHGLVRYVANPLLAAYWWFVRRLIRW